ncbi:exosortase K [Brumimicrobium mesophilum]|uniref:exosortase K n=1 Tax=Brumimicrobium mesophilum TaxID=392717 RepID=UPI000D144A3C
MTRNKNILFYLTALGIFILLKLLYTLSETSDLLFILSPTNKIIELITGSQATFIIGEGYFYDKLNIIIDKSCSGFNFWLLCFLMLSFLSIKYFTSSLVKALMLLISFVGAYIFTVLVNSSRIFTSIIIEKKFHSLPNQSVIHEGIGIITNLTFLILIYLAVEKILQKRNSHANIA